MRDVLPVLPLTSERKQLDDFGRLFAQVVHAAACTAVDDRLRRFERLLEKYEQPELMSPADAARFLSISPRTLKRIATKHAIPVHHVGRLVRYAKEDLERLTKVEMAGTQRTPEQGAQQLLASKRRAHGQPL